METQVGSLSAQDVEKTCTRATVFRDQRKWVKFNVIVPSVAGGI
jgi:hypothetical protein